MFEPRPTAIPGCLELRPTPHQDHRGRFVKAFHTPTFDALGLRTDFKEAFHSTSHAGVLRGMHFQIPPCQHAKLVTCLTGGILDVVLDLRRASPTFGQAVGVELSAETGALLYVPEGCAHGFLAREASLVHYSVTSEHAPDCDRGIRWDSFGFPWPVTEPILSARDQAFPALDAFSTPF